jgi:hypothetical protein
MIVFRRAPPEPGQNPAECGRTLKMRSGRKECKTRMHILCQGEAAKEGGTDRGGAAKEGGSG